MSKQEVLFLVAGLILAAAAIIAALALTAAQRRSARLRRRFGPEYKRSLRAQGDRDAAEQELAGRISRRRELHILALPADVRARYQMAWQKVQMDFLDYPRRAIADADALVIRVMSERGYPMADFDQRAADVSVDHADVVENYRSAHAIARESGENRATTEQLRQAMTQYRALFLRLLDDGAGPHPAAAQYAGPAATTTTTAAGG